MVYSMNIQGKRVVITGATGGIGKAIALWLARCRARLALQYRDHSKITTLLKDIKRIDEEYYSSDDNIIIVKADVSRYDDVRDMVDSVVNAMKGIDALIAVAGYPISREEWFIDPLSMDDELLDRPWRIDLKGSYHCVRAVTPVMKSQGNGSILLISSTPALVGDVNGLAYTLAKAAVIALVKSLAPVLAPEVRINALALGSIATDANMSILSDEEIDGMVKNIPMKRFGRADEVASTASFLISDHASYITGQCIVVDGGEVRI